MKNLVSLKEFLEHKTLFYDKIDYDVIAKSWEILSSHVNLPYVIHIVGTNGKGSTGRFLASFLNQLNKDVLHYTSPHIIKFNERIWINGKDSEDAQLDEAHSALFQLLPKEYLDKLTYFEYTTLLAIYLSSNRDYIVLEAGLGGEFDATNVVHNDITVVPSIGLDHMDFLGDTIEQIASTKLRSCDTQYILGKGVPNNIIDLAKELLDDKIFVKFNENIALPSDGNNLPNYLQNNLMLALNVLKHLNLELKNFKIEKIKGRCEKIEDNITIDVGHNPLAAQAIVKHFEGKKVVLIYNSFKDKDFQTIFRLLKPILSKILVIECIDERIVQKSKLFLEAQKLNIAIDDFDIAKLNDNEEYLVFGSFRVVEEFLLLKANFEK